MTKPACLHVPGLVRCAVAGLGAGACETRREDGATGAPILPHSAHVSVSSRRRGFSTKSRWKSASVNPARFMCGVRLVWMWS
jgi:hypothetical protein